MRHMKTGAALFTLIALFAVSATYAQPNISGPQSGTLGPGTYIVVGDIQVTPGATLTIVPGTTFLHNGNHTWKITGQLNAEGAEGDSISFIRQNPIPEHRWGGIRFLTGASDLSTIDYCIVDHCYHDYTVFLNTGAGIYSESVDLIISNSRISNCENVWDGAGIYAYGAALEVNNCLVVDNTTYDDASCGGVFLFYCEGAVITKSVITRNNSAST